MALTWSAGNGNLTVLGTVAEVIGSNGTIGKLPRNFDDGSKLVSLLLRMDESHSEWVSCSKELSKMLRKNELKLSELGNYRVIEFNLNTTGQLINMIVRPDGESTIEWTKLSEIESHPQTEQAVFNQITA